MTQIEANLNEFLSMIKTEASSSRIACVFDIDSTLFCVSTRTGAILKMLAQNESFKSRFPDHAEHLKTIKVQTTDWGIKDPLVRLGVHFPQEVIHEIRKFWKKNFFSNDFLSHDLLYDDANHFVNDLKELNCEILYLTGRSESLMRPGTVQQLSQYSFPLKNPEHLIMKSAEDQEDEDFKLNKLREIVNQFDKVYFFENEPVIIHSIDQELPQVKIVFMNSTHSSRMKVPTHLPTIHPASYKRQREKQ